MQVRSLGREDALEDDMATHPNILAWRIPWTEEPGRPQSIGSQRVRHDQSDLALTHVWVGKIPWERTWQPASVFLPGESHGERGLAGYTQWSRKESD